MKEKKETRLGRKSILERKIEVYKKELKKNDPNEYKKIKKQIGG